MYGANAIGLFRAPVKRWTTTAATQATASATAPNGAPSAAPVSATSLASPQPIPSPREKSAAAANGTKMIAAETMISQSRCAKAKSRMAASGPSVNASGRKPQRASLHQQATSAKITIAAMPSSSGGVCSATKIPPSTAAATTSTAYGGFDVCGPSSAGVMLRQTLALVCVAMNAMQPKKSAARSAAIILV